MDLPGYGYARVSGKGLEKNSRINLLVFFQSHYKQKYVVLLLMPMLALQKMT
jgi:GTP-binding protein EngB required for normal cell division